MGCFWTNFWAFRHDIGQGGWQVEHKTAFQIKVFACKNSEFLRVPMKGAHKSLQQFATLQFATLATMHHGALRTGCFFRLQVANLFEQVSNRQPQPVQFFEQVSNRQPQPIQFGE